MGLVVFIQERNRKFSCMEFYKRDTNRTWILVNSLKNERCKGNKQQCSRYKQWVMLWWNKTKLIYKKVYTHKKYTNRCIRKVDKWILYMVTGVNVWEIGGTLFTHFTQRVNMCLRGWSEYLWGIEDLHSEVLHSCDVPSITVDFIRLGGLRGVVLLNRYDLRTHNVKRELQGSIQGKVSFSKTAFITMHIWANLQWDIIKHTSKHKS